MRNLGRRIDGYLLEDQRYLHGCRYLAEAFGGNRDAADTPARYFDDQIRLCCSWLLRVCRGFYFSSQPAAS